LSRGTNPRGLWAKRDSILPSIESLENPLQNEVEVINLDKPQSQLCIIMRIITRGRRQPWGVT
jgi:hypothetical protein